MLSDIGGLLSDIGGFRWSVDGSAGAEGVTGAAGLRALPGVRYLVSMYATQQSPPRGSKAGPVALAVLVTSLAVGVAGAQQTPAFTTSVDVVRHSVAVLDSRGDPVSGLQAADFRITEDGAAQEISVFLAPGSAPLDIALLLDSSTSLLHWSRVVRNAAKTFLRRLDVRDCVYLLPFNDVVGPARWARSLEPALAARVDGIYMEGGTALHDALIDGLSTVYSMSTGSPHIELDTRAGEVADRGSCASRSDTGNDFVPTRRAALVLLTDGDDHDSETRFDQVLDAARETAIPIFPMVLGAARSDALLGEKLDRLAGETGGTIINAIRPDELESAYDDVVVMLRASYLLGYRPGSPAAQPARERKISVRSLRPSYRLVFREHYYR